MQLANGALTAALAAGSRQETHVTRLGGRDVSAQISSWDLDRSYATDLPAAMRAFSGSASTQLDLSLVGTGGVSAPALYGPWAPHATGDIARPGQSVTHGWGLGAESLDTFRGKVRARTAKSGEDRVSLTALDGSERLRAPARLPRPPQSLTGLETGFALSWYTSSTWAVDELLRNAGINTCPPPRPRCALYASMHGGAMASIGWALSLTGPMINWSTLGAPHEMALRAPAGSLCTTEYRPGTTLVNRASDGTWLEAWINSNSTAGSDKIARYRLAYATSGVSWYLFFEVNAHTNTLTAAYGTSPTMADNAMVTWSASLSGTPGIFHIGWWLTWSGTGIPTVAPVTTQGSTLIFGAAQTLSAAGGVPAGELRSVQVALNNVYAEAMQISQIATKPNSLATVTQSGQWSKGGTLGQAVNPLAKLPAVSGDTWSAINEIAKATLSTAEFDRNGYFRFKDYTRWSTAPTTPDVTVSSAREISSLTIAEEIDACRNDVTVSWVNWAGYVYQAVNIIEEPSAAIAIAPGATLTRTFTIDDNASDPPASIEINDSLTAAHALMIRSVNLPSAPLDRGKIECSVRRVGGTVTLTMVNRGSTTCYYFRVSMQAYVQASESKAPAPAQSSVTNSASQAVYGVQSFTHAADEWVQYRLQAADLATALLAAGAFPAPLISEVEILADPRIDLGDVVRVQDSAGATLSTLAWVIGMRLSGSEGRVTMTLALRGVSNNGVPTDTGLTPDPQTKPGTSA